MKRSSIAIIAIVIFSLLLIINYLFKISPPNNKSLVIFIFTFIIMYFMQRRKENATT